MAGAFAIVGQSQLGILTHDTTCTCTNLGGKATDRARLHYLRGCRPAILSSRYVANSVILFGFGSAMLRVAVPILGTMPREEFWSERGESVRHKSALGFAAGRYSTCPMTCLGHLGSSRIGRGIVAEVGVKVGLQNLRKERRRYDRFIDTHARERVPWVVDCT
jgi:hypothetical protein